MKLKGFDIIGTLKQHKGVVHVGLGQVASLGIGAVLWIVIARLLLPADYGWINYIISLSALVSFGVTLGLPTTVATYYPKERREPLISGSVLAILIAGLTDAYYQPATFGWCCVGCGFLSYYRHFTSLRGNHFFTLNGFWLVMARTIAI